MPQDQSQSDLIAQIQVDEQAVVCPFCEQPLGGEPGIRYGHEILHAGCHQALGLELGIHDESHPRPSDEDMAQLLQMYEEQGDEFESGHTQSLFLD